MPKKKIKNKEKNPGMLNLQKPNPLFSNLETVARNELYPLRVMENSQSLDLENKLFAPGHRQDIDHEQEMTCELQGKGEVPKRL